MAPAANPPAPVSTTVPLRSTPARSIPLPSPVCGDDAYSDLALAPPMTCAGAPDDNTPTPTEYATTDDLCHAPSTRSASTTARSTLAASGSAAPHTPSAPGHSIPAPADPVELLLAFPIG